MKKLFILLVCTGGLLLNFSLSAQDSTNQDSSAQDSGIREITTHNIFKGLFLKVWNKLRSLNPPLKQSARAVPVYTVGIRGAESTDTLLKPYWKNDLAQDAEFQAELRQFTKAQQKLDQGDLEAAVEAFDQFLSDYKNSSLRPNALFAMAISLAGLGKNELSVVSMQLFIEENPQHPLVNDARQVVGELSG
ncbi:MAG: tetratricopeptide repeat protein [Gammaproteobacteria bacterium]